LWWTTPTVITPSGGAHAYFRVPSPPIRNTAGKRGRGIGPNLDWRGIGGYVVAPSAHSGYSWDLHLGIDTPMADVPAALLPVKEKRTCTEFFQLDAVTGLDRYAEAALDKACRAILAARNGEQENTLNSECFSIGTLAGSGQIPTGFARDTLRWAALQIVAYDPNRPWLAGTIEAKVNKAFEAGLRLPRGRRHG